MFNTTSLARAARSAAAIGLIASGLFASSAFASPGVSSSGSVLTDDRGMTLYRYTADQGGVSSCYGGCAAAWPPVLVDSVPSVADPGLAAALGTASRTDGGQQLTYQGSPLYYYVGDSAPGQATGDGSDGVWFAIATN